MNLFYEKIPCTPILFYISHMYDFSNLNLSFIYSFFS